MNMENKSPAEFLGDEKRLKYLVYLVDKLRPDAYEEFWAAIASFVYHLMLVRDKKTGEIDILLSQRLTKNICLNLFENISRKHPAKEESILKYVASFCEWHKIRFLTSPEGKEMEDAANSNADLTYTQPEDDIRSILVTKEIYPKQQEHEVYKGHSILDKLVREEDRARLSKIKQTLRQAIKELDDVERYVIYTRFFDKLAYETIAERLDGDSKKTVYYRKICELAIRKLKRILEEKYGITRLPEQEI
jgi:DNA-directed RNA polymerase specialized sigma24 family protein